MAAEQARGGSAAVDRVYPHIHGYSARMSATAAARLRSDPQVVLVQPDRVMTLAAQPVAARAGRVGLGPAAGVSDDERGGVDRPGRLGGAGSDSACGAN
jgi:Peptidase inhibitor I9